MFRVEKISQHFAGFGEVAPSLNRVVVDGIDTRESALILAEVACSEHADNIGVTYAPCVNGYTFRTSNATMVWYRVKEG